MNLVWLDDFLALAASGNFSRAAEERHMTQPAFSRRIRALEEWLGVVLFDRTSHPATLTEAGLWFQSIAQDLIGRVARIPDEARAVADARSATLRFASTHALSFTFLPGWLRRLEAFTPVGPIQLVSDVLGHCETLMAQGRVQFLLCHWHEEVRGTLDPAEHRSIQVGQDLIVPVSAADETGAPRHRLGAPGAKQMPLLAYSKESGIGQLVRALRGAALDKACGEAVFTAHLASVLRSIALEGRGIAFLPRSLIEADIAAGQLVPAGDASWAIPVQIRLVRRRAVTTPTGEALWRAATQASEAAK